MGGKKIAKAKSGCGSKSITPRKNNGGKKSDEGGKKKAKPNVKECECVKIPVSYLDPDDVAEHSSSNGPGQKAPPKQRKVVREAFIPNHIDDEVYKPDGSGRIRNKYPGVRRRKWGSIVAELQDPFTERKVWLGTFGTAEEAYEAVLAKKDEFRERKKTQASMDRTRPGCETGADHGSSENIGEQSELGLNSDQIR